MFRDIIYSLLNIKNVVPILTIVFQTANGVSFYLYKLRENKVLFINRFTNEGQRYFANSLSSGLEGLVSFGASYMGAEKQKS